MSILLADLTVLVIWLFAPVWLDNKYNSLTNQAKRGVLLTGKQESCECVSLMGISIMKFGCSFKLLKTFPTSASCIVKG